MRPLGDQSGVFRGVPFDCQEASLWWASQVSLRLIYDPFSEFLFELSDSFTLTRRDPRVWLSVSLPSGVRPRDFAVVGSLSTLVYAFEDGLYALPLTGGTEPLGLGVEGHGAISQVTLDATSGLLYFATTDTVYSFQADTEEVRQVMNGTCAIQDYLVVREGEGYVPILCGEALCMRAWKASGAMSEAVVSAVRVNSSVHVAAIFPEAQYFVWSNYGAKDSPLYSNCTSFTWEGDQLVMGDTSRCVDGLLRSVVFVEATEEAVALKYCHLAGELTDSQCDCSPTYYGDACQVYCDPSQSCVGGQCREDGSCECLEGYHAGTNGGCELNSYGVVPKRPAIYSTQYEEVTSTTQSTWVYSSDRSVLAISTRRVDDATTYDLQDYREALCFSRRGSECQASELASPWPMDLVPSGSLLLGHVSCPRDGSRECLHWKLPKSAGFSWTTEFQGMPVWWQEQLVEAKSGQSTTRQYALEYTSVSGLPADWKDTPGCPCFEEGTCYKPNRDNGLMTISISFAPVGPASSHSSPEGALYWGLGGAALLVLFCLLASLGVAWVISRRRRQHHVERLGAVDLDDLSVYSYRGDE